MNDRRSRYNESSGKNKALTAQIKEAELILQQLEQDLEAEQGTLRQLKAADAEWQGHQETVRSYCELLDTVRAAPPSLLLETTRISPGAADDEESTPGAIGGGSSRRFDISEQLMDPVTLLCHKMERLWAKQMDMLMDPMTPTERQAHRNFETEIQQLLTKQHSHQFLTSVQSLLDHELERLERLAMDMGAPLPATTTPQDRENNSDKENAPQFGENAMEDKENAPPTLMPSPSPPPATRAAPSASALAVEEGSELMFRKCADEICQQQKILLKNALELEEQGTQWEQRLQDLERQAFERILKLYENSDIQEAHLYEEEKKGHQLTY
ncbi:hypothetical protein BC940DRAFT_300083 [Gongronella butleri]|nr:hypothetical protein BC940DRAFT_300083 [Gongronella butleri]